MSKDLPYDILQSVPALVGGQSSSDAQDTARGRNPSLGYTDKTINTLAKVPPGVMDFRPQHICTSEPVISSNKGFNAKDTEKVERPVLSILESEQQKRTDIEEPIILDQWRLFLYEHKFKPDEQNENDPRPIRIQKARDAATKVEEVAYLAQGTIAAVAAVESKLSNLCYKLAGILVQKSIAGNAKISEAEVIANYMQQRGPLMYEFARKTGQNVSGIIQIINQCFIDAELLFTVDDERYQGVDQPIRVGDRHLQEGEIPAGSLRFVGARGKTLVVIDLGIHPIHLKRQDNLSP